MSLKRCCSKDASILLLDAQINIIPPPRPTDEDKDKNPRFTHSFKGLERTFLNCSLKIHNNIRF